MATPFLSAIAAALIGAFAGVSGGWLGSLSLFQFWLACRRIEEGLPQSLSHTMPLRRCR